MTDEGPPRIPKRSSSSMASKAAMAIPIEEEFLNENKMMKIYVKLNRNKMKYIIEIFEIVNFRIAVNLLL
jgi:hypothetical protein